LESTIAPSFISGGALPVLFLRTNIDCLTLAISKSV